MANQLLNDGRWLLPEGVEELRPRQARNIERLQRRLTDLFHVWGYELVIPPLIEYVESLLTGAGEDLDLQSFKITDQLNGRLMAVRADMTPQAARIDAHCLRQDVPTRLCYLGPVLRTKPQGINRTRSPIQVGAELYGHGGDESDIEILRLMIATLLSANIGPFYLDLGHTAIFRSLAQSAGLTGEQEKCLFEVMQRKAVTELDAMLGEFDIDDSKRQMLRCLPDLNGDDSTLETARDRLQGAPQAVFEAIQHLERITSALRRQYPDVPLHFDLAELRGYHYQNGVVFAAFAPGQGQEIARGGRYDGIGAVFGRARPATGFSSDLQALMALSRDEKIRRDGILAPWSDEPELEAKVAELRMHGERVVYLLPGQVDAPAEQGCYRKLRKIDGEWRVESLPEASKGK